MACLLCLTDSHLLLAQEGAHFLADGFVRPLLKLALRELHSLASLAIGRRHFLLVLRRESGESDWLFLRNEDEQERLVGALQRDFGLPVEEWREQAALSDPLQARRCRQCAQLPDLFHKRVEPDPAGTADF